MAVKYKSPLLLQLLPILIGLNNSNIWYDLYDQFVYFSKSFRSVSSIIQFSWILWCEFLSERDDKLAYFIWHWIKHLLNRIFIYDFIIPINFPLLVTGWFQHLVICVHTNIIYINTPLTNLVHYTMGCLFKA